MTSYQLQRFLNALVVFILSGVIIGAYVYQHIEKEDPCSLCELQRLAMISASIGFMMNLRFFIHPIHYSIVLASSLFGGAVALRQIGLHVCVGFPVFGVRIWDLELYTWSFLVFSATILATIILLFLYKTKNSEPKPSLHPYEKAVISLMFLVTFANVVTTLLQ